MTNGIGRVAAVVVATCVAGAALTGCTGSSPKGTAGEEKASGAASTVKAVPPGAAPLRVAPKVTRAKDLGVPVTGDFGAAPTVRLPSGPAPRQRSLQVLHAGTGSPVELGRLLVAQYQITTWGDGKAERRVIDDAFARQSPVAVLVGARQALDDWDAALVGQKAGSRVLLLLPGSGGASAIGRPKAVVVDILAVLPGDVAAGGSVVGREPGLPEVVTGPDHRPAVRSVDGVTGRPASQLVLAGTGPALASGKTLVLHVLQADATTGRTLSQTWGGVPMIERAASLQAVVPALVKARVGSRAVAVVPPAAVGSHAQVLVIDVLGQV